MAFGDLLEIVGGLGRYQVVHVLLLSFPLLFTASNNILQNFVAAVPDHHCRLGRNLNVTWDPLVGDLVTLYVPVDQQGRADKCRLYTAPQWHLLWPNGTRGNGSGAETRPCTDGWEYDRSQFSATIVTESQTVAAPVCTMAFGDLLEIVGGLGWFQVVHVLLLDFPALFIASHNLLQNFVAAVPDHHCRLGLGLGRNLNVTLDPLVGDLVTLYVPVDQQGRADKCRLYTAPQWHLLWPNGTRGNGSGAETRPCTDGWEYDRSQFSATIVTEVGTLMSI